jgi:ribosomal protein S18 acetylase RimI-like enzyme
MPDTIIPTLKLSMPIPARPVLPFVQTLSLTDNRRSIGSVTWYAPATDDGVVQILNIQIDPLHQRQGHGSTLIRAAYEQAHRLFAAIEIKPRRVWVAVEQKNHVNARAFLSRHGYQHVSSIKNVYRKQESLIYLRAFD